MQKLNNARKSQTCRFHGLRVKETLMNRQKTLREGFAFAFWFMLTFHSKMIWIKSILSYNLTFINPQSAHLGLKCLKKNSVIQLYWFAMQQKQLNTSKIARLTQHFRQNRMDLFLTSIRRMKQLRNIKKESNAGKTQIYEFRVLRVKKVELKLKAPEEFYKVFLTISQNSL